MRQTRATQPEITSVPPPNRPYDLRAGAAAANRRAARSRRHWLLAYQSASRHGQPGAAKNRAGRPPLRWGAVPGGWAGSPSFPGCEAGRSSCARAASPQRGEERNNTPAFSRERCRIGWKCAGSRYWSSRTGGRGPARRRFLLA